MVNMYFNMLYVNSIRWHPSLFNVLAIVTSLLLSTGAMYNQGFAYGCIGFGSLTGVCWFLQMVFGIISKLFPNWVAYYLVPGLALIGIGLGFMAIGFARRKPQSLVLKSILSIMSGAFYAAFATEQILSWGAVRQGNWIRAVAAVIYITYIVLTSVAYFSFFKKDEVKEPYPCEIPRRYTRSGVKSSKTKNNNVMPSPGQGAPPMQDPSMANPAQAN